MKKPVAFVGVALLSSAFAVQHASVDVRAAGSVFTYRANGWTLTLHPKKAWYGTGVAGSLIHAGKTYHVEGDWIPAGDAGGDLLRFYGRPFPTPTVLGLVSVATLYSTCVPDCASSKTYQLKAIGQWTLPGAKGRTIKLVLQT